MKALEEAKKKWAFGDKEAAKEAAKSATKVCQHLQRRVAVALDGLCAVRVCREQEADHCILAAFMLDEIDYVWSSDLDYIVMVVSPSPPPSLLFISES